MEFYFPSRKYNGLLNMEFISLKGVISRSHLLESLKNIKSSKSSLNPFFYWQTKMFTIDWQKLKHVLFFNVFKLTDNITLVLDLFTLKFFHKQYYIKLCSYILGKYLLVSSVSSIYLYKLWELWVPFFEMSQNIS